jgi:four helix bundle protein
MAQASLAELETQLEIAVRLRYLLPSAIQQIQSDINSLGKQMYGCETR